jgi:biotin carboxylase
MTPERTLLLVGGKETTLRKAKAYGLDVVFIQHMAKFTPVQAELADATFLVDYTDWDVVRPLAEAAKQIWDYSAAVSPTEPCLDIAARINDMYGLGGTSYEVSRRMRDKWAMRQHLAGVGAPTVGAGLVTGEDALADFGAAHGYPFVVKPLNLTAGFGIFRVTGPGDTGRVWQAIQELRRTGMTRGSKLFTIGDFLMEQYISGPEFSVEGFSFNGRHIAVAVTEKTVDEEHFAELGHTVPARVPAAVEDEVVTAATTFLDAIGFKDGPTHTEVRLGPEGPRVIESHNRLGGAYINELVHAAYGIDLAAWTLGWPFGLVEELHERPKPIGGSCTRFLLSDPGVIESIDGVDRVRAHPDVIAAELSKRPGDTVRPLQDNWDRLGLVAVKGPDTAAAVKLCEELIDKALNVRMADTPTGDAR